MIHDYDGLRQHLLTAAASPYRVWPEHDHEVALDFLTRMEAAGVDDYTKGQYLISGDVIIEALAPSRAVRPFLNDAVCNAYRPNFDAILNLVETTPLHTMLGKSRFEAWAVRGATNDNRVWRHVSDVADVWDGYDAWMQSLSSSSRNKMRRADKTLADHTVVLHKTLPTDLRDACFAHIRNRWDPDFYGYNVGALNWVAAVAESGRHETVILEVRDPNGVPVAVGASHLSGTQLVFNSFNQLVPTPNIGQFMLHAMVKEAIHRDIPVFNSTRSCYINDDHAKPFEYKRFVNNIVLDSGFYSAFAYGYVGNVDDVPVYDPSTGWTPMKGNP